MGNDQVPNEVRSSLLPWCVQLLENAAGYCRVGFDIVELYWYCLEHLREHPSNGESQEKDERNDRTEDEMGLSSPGQVDHACVVYLVKNAAAAVAFPNSFPADSFTIQPNSYINAGVSIASICSVAHTTQQTVLQRLPCLAHQLQHIIHSWITDRVEEATAESLNLDACWCIPQWQQVLSDGDVKAKTWYKLLERTVHPTKVSRSELMRWLRWGWLLYIIAKAKRLPLFASKEKCRDLLVIVANTVAIQLQPSQLNPSLLGNTSSNRAAAVLEVMMALVRCDKDTVLAQAKLVEKEVYHLMEAATNNFELCGVAASADPNKYHLQGFIYTKLSAPHVVGRCCKHLEHVYAVEIVEAHGEVDERSCLPMGTQPSHAPQWHTHDVGVQQQPPHEAPCALKRASDVPLRVLHDDGDGVHGVLDLTTGERGVSHDSEARPHASHGSIDDAADALQSRGRLPAHSLPARDVAAAQDVKEDVLDFAPDELVSAEDKSAGHVPNGHHTNRQKIEQRNKEESNKRETSTDCHQVVHDSANNKHHSSIVRINALEVDTTQDGGKQGGAKAGGSREMPLRNNGDGMEALKGRVMAQSLVRTIAEVSKGDKDWIEVDTDSEDVSEDEEFDDDEDEEVHDVVDVRVGRVDDTRTTVKGLINREVAASDVLNDALQGADQTGRRGQNNPDEESKPSAHLMGMDSIDAKLSQPVYTARAAPKDGLLHSAGQQQAVQAIEIVMHDYKDGQGFDQIFQISSEKDNTHTGLNADRSNNDGMLQGQMSGGEHMKGTKAYQFDNTGLDPSRGDGQDVGDGMGEGKLGKGDGQDSDGGQDGVDYVMRESMDMRTGMGRVNGRDHRQGRKNHQDSVGVDEREESLGRHEQDARHEHDRHHQLGRADNVDAGCEERGDQQALREYQPAQAHGYNHEAVGTGQDGGLEKESVQHGRDGFIKVMQSSQLEDETAEGRFMREEEVVEDGVETEMEVRRGLGPVTRHVSGQKMSISVGAVGTLDDFAEPVRRAPISPRHTFAFTSGSGLQQSMSYPGTRSQHESSEVWRKFQVLNPLEFLAYLSSQTSTSSGGIPTSNAPGPEDDSHAPACVSMPANHLNQMLPSVPSGLTVQSAPTAVAGVLSKPRRSSANTNISLHVRSSALPTSPPPPSTTPPPPTSKPQRSTPPANNPPPSSLPSATLPGGLALAWAKPIIEALLASTNLTQQQLVRAPPVLVKQLLTQVESLLQVQDMAELTQDHPLIYNIRTTLSLMSTVCGLQSGVRTSASDNKHPAASGGDGQPESHPGIAAVLQKINGRQGTGAKTGPQGASKGAADARDRVSGQKRRFAHESTPLEKSEMPRIQISMPSSSLAATNSAPAMSLQAVAAALQTDPSFSFQSSRAFLQLAASQNARTSPRPPPAVLRESASAHAAISISLRPNSPMKQRVGPAAQATTQPPSHSNPSRPFDSNPHLTFSSRPTGMQSTALPRWLFPDQSPTMEQSSPSLINPLVQQDRSNLAPRHNPSPPRHTSLHPPDLPNLESCTSTTTSLLANLPMSKHFQEMMENVNRQQPSTCLSPPTASPPAKKARPTSSNPQKSIMKDFMAGYYSVANKLVAEEGISTFKRNPRERPSSSVGAGMGASQRSMDVGDFRQIHSARVAASGSVDIDTRYHALGNMQQGITSGPMVLGARLSEPSSGGGYSRGGPVSAMMDSAAVANGSASLMLQDSSSLKLPARGSSLSGHNQLMTASLEPGTLRLSHLRHPSDSSRSALHDHDSINRSTRPDAGQPAGRKEGANHLLYIRKESASRKARVSAPLGSADRLPDLPDTEDVSEIAKSIVAVLNSIQASRDVRKKVMMRLRSMTSDERIITYVDLRDACMRNDWEGARDSIAQLIGDE